LIAMLALSAVSVAAAQADSAPRWKSGAFIAAGKPKAFTATNVGQVRLISGGLTMISSNCTITGQIIGSAAGSPGTAKEAVLTCTGMSVLNSGGKCVVGTPGKAAGELVSEKLNGQLVWLNSTGEASGIKVKAESGSLLGRISISGAECPVGGSHDLTGELITSVTPVASEAKELTLGLPDPSILTWWSNTEARVKQSIESTRLKMGAGNATLLGSFSFGLNEKVVFGVFAG
jgi:hypothetical protein